jgi:glycosyltransferase involved in cell wall biosynthesis
MYTTVTSVDWQGGHLQGDTAYAVSLAACGHGREAAEFARMVVRRHGIRRYLIQLADDFAPYLPSLSLELLSTADARVSVPPTLRLALLLRCGGRQEARDYLEALTDNEEMAAALTGMSPELLLLSSNVLRDAPANQVARLNAYWATQGLTSVALIDDTQAPSARNMRPASKLPVVDGPLVSVLLTAYNSADRVGTALRSLLQQTYRNIEIIAVDDASTDNTWRVLLDAAKQDGRVRPVSTPLNVGTYVAKHIGFTYASGEFIICHDSDDWSHPLRLERQVMPLLREARLAATTSNWVRIEDDGTFFARPVHPVARLNPSSPLFRKELINTRIGLWDPVRTGADTEFHARLKLVFGGHKVRRVSAALALGAHHPDSLMNAEGTGYVSDGTSPKRLAYRESWSHWHIRQLHSGRYPVMPMLSEYAKGIRPFAVASDANVASEIIEKCLRSVAVKI